MTARKGLLIAIEGIDGSGKTTQLPLLAGWLRGQGHDVLETSEPTGGPYGRQIRALYHNRAQVSPQKELELFLLDRRQHVEECIQPALDRGQIVLTDRYYFSTAAYQGAGGRAPGEILALNAFAPEPDMVLLLTLSVEEGLERIRKGRGETPNDFERQDQLAKVAALFASFAAPCIVRIPAAAPAGEVQDALRRAVRRLLEERGLACTG